MVGVFVSVVSRLPVGEFVVLGAGVEEELALSPPGGSSSNWGDSLCCPQPVIVSARIDDWSKVKNIVVRKETDRELAGRCIGESSFLR